MGVRAKNGALTNYLVNGLLRPQKAWDGLDPNLPKSRELGKPAARLSSTFSLCVKLRTLDNSVEKRFSAVSNSKPSSSSSSPEDKLSACSGGCLDGRELLSRCMCLCNRSSLSLKRADKRNAESRLVDVSLEICKRSGTRDDTSRQGTCVTKRTEIRLRWHPTEESSSFEACRTSTLGRSCWSAC